MNGDAETPTKVQLIHKEEDIYIEVEFGLFSKISFPLAKEISEDAVNVIKQYISNKYILKIAEWYGGDPGYIWFYLDMIKLCSSYLSITKKYPKLQTQFQRFFNPSDGPQQFHDSVCLAYIDKMQDVGKVNIAGMNDFDMANIRFEVKTILKYRITLPLSQNKIINNEVLLDHFFKLMQLIKSRVISANKQIKNGGAILVSLWDPVSSKLLEIVFRQFIVSQKIQPKVDDLYIILNLDPNKEERIIKLNTNVFINSKILLEGYILNQFFDSFAHSLNNNGDMEVSFPIGPQNYGHVLIYGEKPIAIAGISVNGNILLSQCYTLSQDACMGIQNSSIKVVFKKEKTKI